MLEISADLGKSWSELPVPIAPDELAATANMPGNLFIADGGTLAFSADSGANWTNVPDYSDPILWQQFRNKRDFTPYRLDVTPYMPLSVLGVKDKHLYVLDVSVNGSGLLQPALPNDDRNNRLCCNNVMDRLE